MTDNVRNYVLWAMRSTDFQRKSSKRFLLIYMILDAIALCLSQEIWFICVVVTLLTANIVCAIVFYKKWSPLVGFISKGTQSLSLCLYFDLLCYGMYYCAGLFVWYEYIIAIGIQLVAFILSLLFAHLDFKSFKNTRKYNNFKKASAISGSIAGFTCSATTIICRLFFTDMSINVVVTLISALLYISVCLLLIGVCMHFHIVYLIKKYKIDPSKSETSDDL